MVVVMTLPFNLCVVCWCECAGGCVGWMGRWVGMRVGGYVRACACVRVRVCMGVCVRMISHE